MVQEGRRGDTGRQALGRYAGRQAGRQAAGGAESRLRVQEGGELMTAIGNKTISSKSTSVGEDTRRS